ncbi:MAG: voltage-gated potassium channel [Thermoleophilaceae bacterium]|jgi:hypothetical protein|nr:voltage-gated potassium channel [Thermoleophilaceae bacterium]
MYAFDAVRQAGAELRRVARAETALHERLRRHLTAIIVLTLAIDVVSAALAYLFEHDAKQTQIKTLGSALFWTSTQLLTVSSSVANPITPAGQILDVFMEIWAVVVVTSTAGAIGAFLVKRL